MSKRFLSAFVAIIVFTASAFAQADRGIMVREAQIFVSPDANSPKLGMVARGREVAVIEKSHDFIKVFAGIPPQWSEYTSDKQLQVTGWILDKGLIRNSTPNGDRILFGEAVDSESEASRRHGRKGAAQDAMWLYYHIAEYFPNSPLAGESMWRAADIQWQLEKEDARARPSAKERDPYLHAQINESFMKEVQKKFPGTKWADLAAFNRLDNKICGEWQGLPKCPENESDMYEKYVREHPQSPKAAEALYEAAWRQAALVDIYKERHEDGKADSAKAKSIALGQNIISQYAQQPGDWGARAQRLMYLLDQKIPVYGTRID
jgi:hypothetical protein